MARTLDEIYQALVTEKNAQASLNDLQPTIDDEQTLLADLNTPSAVADWRLWLYIVALAIWTHEKLWDLFRSETDALAQNSIACTAPYLAKKAYEFQLGYELEFLNNKFQYADTTSPAALAAQIVKRVAIVESGGVVRFKVAKLVAGVVTPLSAPEITAFDAYMHKLCAAGTNKVVISSAPDELWLELDVVYDPQVLAPDGSLLGNPSVFPLEDAINNYISNLPFNGMFTLTALTDAMQKATGVVRPIVSWAQARYGFVTWIDIHDEYFPDAGHMIYYSSVPLSAGITYEADV